MVKIFVINGVLDYAVFIHLFDEINYKRADYLLTGLTEDYNFLPQIILEQTGVECDKNDISFCDFSFYINLISELINEFNEKFYAEMTQEIEEKR